ncbi:MAG: FtsQ-type POTRA domain-containing protein [Coriobacteriales bacterium]|nr:FtsQ-type POTRA domain-containing protein [Coriobacteriales bacterium]
MPSVDRSTVSYAQSAKSDLTAQTPAVDSRNRYARLRTEQPVRVLGDPSESRAKGRHQINDAPLGGQGASSRRAGGSTGAGARGAAGRRAQRDEYRTTPLTVREHRERERQFRKQQDKAPRRILIAVITLIALVAIGFLVYQSPAFTIATIEVEGVERLSGERLTTRAAIPAGSTLLRLDTAAVIERLETDPWVASAEIRRSFPSTITLVVRERQIAAVIEVSGSNPTSPLTNWLVSYDGLWLGSLGTQAAAGSGTGEGKGANNAEGNGAEGDGANAGADTAGAGAQTSGDASGTGAAGGTAGSQTSASTSSVLEGVHIVAAELTGTPRVIDVSRSANPQLGETITDQGVLNALDIINGFTPEMRVLLRSISAPDRVRTNLTLTNNVVVAFGAADDVEAKEKAILKLLADYEGRLSYINVRVADHATVRAT